ncbi:BamA/TamA family outer membrane protein [Sphingorhabdus sp. Alg239-R122]|uniref:autotransporter assembly complex protein TamA n=1 Tax=Sphingorhabdus sp. Alg239-R122 TaxID=2305989 RepID=UPI0013DB8768|nr:BamA/TamA family outer membrane protein [Sphingorhabdus sp. Alg239-R122]
MRALSVAVWGGALVTPSMVVAQQEQAVEEQATDTETENNKVQDRLNNSDEAFLSEALDPDAPLAPMPDMEVDWPGFEDLPPLPGPQPLAENESDATGEIETDQPVEQLVTEEEERFREREEAASAANFVDLGDSNLSYQVKFDYLDSTEFVADQRGEFESRFNQLSKLRNLDDDDANIAQISRRASEDRKLLDQLLRNYGYYDSEIYQLIERGGTAGELEVEFGLQLGPVYTLDDINLGSLLTIKDDYPMLRDAFGLESGTPINSDEIVAANLRLDESLAENGYAFAAIGEPDLLIDHADNTGDLTVPVTPEDKYQFGQIIAPDETLMSARHYQRIARFEPGDVYQRSRMDDLRRAILATGLVSSLTLTPVKSEDSNTQGDIKTVNVQVDAVAAPLRTIAGELGYGSGEGFRAEVSWEHRNFFPSEGLVRARGVAGTQEQLVSLLFRRNNFKERDQVLTAQLLVSNINRDAFEASTILLRAGLERQTNLIFQKKWTWSIGAEILATDERDITADNLGTQRKTFFIGALPATLNYDGSNDLLDPTTGFRLGGQLSPEISLQDGTFTYVRAQLDTSYYQPVSDNVVIAGRARVASIIGADLLQVAPSRRLYAGGGGSVRGFGFQQIGPRDINNDPIGGRSLVEFSLETRVRFGNFGVVPFIDAGNIYSDVFPDKASLRFGAGIGVRYYSSFGPIRVDVGTPINPQPGDSRIGVYISLGQAF